MTDMLYCAKNRHIVSHSAFDADAIWLVERAEQAIGSLPIGAQYCVWSHKIAAA
jgi:hypothetical protein